MNFVSESRAIVNILYSVGLSNVGNLAVMSFSRQRADNSHLFAARWCRYVSVDAFLGKEKMHRCCSAL